MTAVSAFPGAVTGLVGKVNEVETAINSADSLVEEAWSEMTTIKNRVDSIYNNIVGNRISRVDLFGSRLDYSLPRAYEFIDFQSTYFDEHICTDFHDEVVLGNTSMGYCAFEYHIEPCGDISDIRTLFQCQPNYQSLTSLAGQLYQYFEPTVIEIREEYEEIREKLEDAEDACEEYLGPFGDVCIVVGL